MGIPNESGTISDGNCVIIDDTRQTQKFLDNKTRYPASTGQTLVENNVCAGNGGRGVHVFSSDNVMVRHNTLYQDQQTATINDGELTAGDASNVRFVNKVVYIREGRRANGTSNASNVVFERNLYFNTSDIPNAAADDLIGVDPLFVQPGFDIASADFELQPSSPARSSSFSRAATGSMCFQSLLPPLRRLLGRSSRPIGSAQERGCQQHSQRGAVAFRASFLRS